MDPPSKINSQHVLEIAEMMTTVSLLSLLIGGVRRSSSFSFSYNKGARRLSSSLKMSGLTYTTLQSISPLVENAHQICRSQLTHSYDFRITQLRGIERLITENSSSLADAIEKDLGQGPMYAEAFELSQVISHSTYSRRNLKEWMSTKRTPTPWPVNLNIPVHSELTPNPRGVALILTPWNLPILLTLVSIVLCNLAHVYNINITYTVISTSWLRYLNIVPSLFSVHIPKNPLIDAITAGNVCILKMSEKSVHCTQLLTELIAKYIDSRAVMIVNGGADVATELLKQRFDVISYTGGITVGRIVAAAAAKQLTPVLLELGGKNPVFVTKNAHLPSAALRIAWGKVTGNTGQMCKFILQCCMLFFLFFHTII